jgi:hypothetical protein
MTEQGFAACLAAVLNGEVDVNESFDPAGIDRAVPYDEVGMLTRNAGLVVVMDDGAEYQLTVVRSRAGR